MEVWGGGGPHNTEWLKLDQNNMWVDGTLVGDPGSCYYGLFKSLIADQKTWIVGTMLLKEYYTIFDMSPYDDYNQDYI